MDPSGKKPKFIMLFLYIPLDNSSGYMLITEIEDAEKQAERVLLEAREKASARLAKAKSRQYDDLVEGASKKSALLLEKTDSEARTEAKRIAAGGRKLSIPAESKQKLADQLCSEIINSARGKNRSV